MDSQRYLRAAGTLSFAATSQFLIAMNVAEFLYPNYSVSAQPISDLGATCVSTGGISSCTIHEPSAAIFDLSVFLLGFLTFLGSYLINRAGYRGFSIVFMLSAIGIMGVGLFPETTGVVHTIVSLIAFLFGGISAIASYRLARPPLSFFFIILGTITLIALVLYASGTYLGLGAGGMERMIAYPASLWSLGLGAMLIGKRDGPAS